MSMLPRHIVIIMDGNGRWAKKRSLSRSAGHKAGGEAAKEVIKNCAEKKIEALTLFAFGIENWARPKKEVHYLMDSFLKQLQKTQELHGKNIKLRIIGDHTRLSTKLQKKILESQQLTENNTGLQLNVAINYSGRWDIVEAVKKIVATNLVSEDISETTVQQMVCLGALPEPDLLIRTSGEQRLSNFMLWQLAYTELYFTDTLWPDFNEEELERALDVYGGRERRFGEIKSP